MKKPRVLIADDHRMLLEAFQSLLEPEFEIVAAVSNGRAAVEAGERLRPDIALLDISMPELNGLDAGRLLLERCPGIRVVYMTVNEDPIVAAEAFRLGASGYLLKTAAASELFLAVNVALEGGTHVPPTLAQEIMVALGEDQSQRPSSRLSTRQREVLQLLAEGRTMKEIAGTLHITARTVAYHKYRMMQQLGIATSAELIQYGIRNGLCSS
ncbi:MAG: DNA-binding NarL/FixJ family response regulator [Phycisphaerales bacterium]|jgi:DNA-binding NarL/FixJ family response regulator